jgi:uracil phosphoribosyltransferase
MPMITIINKSNSVFNQYLAEIRDQQIQQDSMRFRKNLERMGEIIAYEISKTLPYKNQQIQTPLGIADENVPTEIPVITSILRAGLPIHQGLLNIFDKSPNGFITASRIYDKEGTFSINVEYMSCPDIKNKIVILADAVIASGSSMELAYRALINKGTPQHTHIIALIASKEGLSYLKKKLSTQKLSIWVGAVDDELTVKSYIVPGLGDAGDLAFGAKTNPV